MLYKSPAFLLGPRPGESVVSAAPKETAAMPAKSSSSAASRVTPARNGAAPSSTSSRTSAAAASKEPKILFQKYFKSIGTRTYAAHLKENDKGNQFLVLTEGKRDPQTGEMKKTKVFIYSEDFAQY